MAKGFVLCMLDLYGATHRHKTSVGCWLYTNQGTLTKGKGTVQLNTTLKIACFVKTVFTVSKAADLN